MAESGCVVELGGWGSATFRGAPRISSQNEGELTMKVLIRSLTEWPSRLNSHLQRLNSRRFERANYSLRAMLYTLQDTDGDTLSYVFIMIVSNEGSVLIQA